MLTKLFFIFIAILILCSCGQSKHKSIEETVHPTDTSCIKEISEAKADIINERLVFCNDAGSLLWQPLRAEKQMDSLLKRYNIGYKNESSPDVVQDDKTYNCYCGYMQEQINLKYGKKFRDSLLNIADSLFILKNLDKTYDNGSTADSWDKPPIFPGDSSYDQTNHSGLQKEFNKLVKYPNGLWGVF